MKRASLFLVVCFAFAAVSTCADAAKNNNKGKNVTTEKIMVIETSFGSIEIKFYPNKAPKHVEAIQKLTGEGFYNGTTFHRVIPGFMIQGGDPNSKSQNRAMHGMGGPGFTIPAEFNDVPHKRGVCSMARSQNPNSAGSQFFICVASNPSVSGLDRQYTVWGECIKGMEVADAIVAVKRDQNDNPLQRIEMKVSLKDVK